MMNMDLLSAIATLSLERTTDELGKTNFIAVTEITTIAKFFKMNLNDIDEKFQELKDTKYNYEQFCDLCDEGKEEDTKKLSEVFDYLEIKEFAYMIINKVADKMKERISERL